MIRTAPSEPTRAPSEPTRVLVVDDQQFDRHRLARLCSSLPAPPQVANAESLAAMVPQINASRFDLIFLDYHLPDGTGLDGVEILRRSSKNASVPTIMVSGVRGTKIAQAAKQAGCTEFLSKENLTLSTFQQATKRALTVPPDLTNLTLSDQNTLSEFSAARARDLKPMVSRLLRQLRDMRSLNDAPIPARAEAQREIEKSCLKLWDYVEDMGHFYGPDPEVQETPKTEAGVLRTRRPPSVFGRQRH